MELNIGILPVNTGKDLFHHYQKRVTLKSRQPSHVRNDFLFTLRKVSPLEFPFAQIDAVVDQRQFFQRIFQLAIEMGIDRFADGDPFFSVHGK